MSDRPIPTETEEASGFRRFEEALPIALLRSREAVMARFRPHLARHGMTEQQWRVIRIVQQRPGIDATALSEACCILMPSLSRMLKALETDNLLIRQKVEDDMRRQVITLTPEGEAKFAEMVPQAEAIYAQIEAEFGKQEMDSLIEKLQVLRRNLKTPSE